MPTRVLLIAALIVCAAVYWPGLAGPFLYDDMPNLYPVLGWFGLQADWQEAVFGNHSGLFGRPIPMLTFMASASSHYFSVFDFKLDNLLVHLLCGVLIWQVLRRALTLDPAFERRANIAALAIATLWLLHPMQASTVLYVIQRMAQLSALFVLAAIWAYLVGRRKLATGDMRAARIHLFMLFPLLFLAGLLSKENAVVAPALCLVLELAYFNRRQRPGRTVQVFFAVFLALPLALGLAYLAMTPDGLLGGYLNRDYTLAERTLTQARALASYISMLLWPRPELMGLYTDDFTVSTGLWSPVSTFWSLLGLALASAFAIALRKRAPSLFAGWFFFLAAHAMESSIFPLDLYYEHRNYLPAVGLLLACTGLAGWIAHEVRLKDSLAFAGGLALAGAFGLWFAHGTYSRALVWQDKASIVALGVQRHPESLRAHLDRASLAMARDDYAAAHAGLASMRGSSDSRQRMLAQVSSIAIMCKGGMGATSVQMQAAIHGVPATVTTHEPQAFGHLAGAVIHAGCGSLAASDIADAIDHRLSRNRPGSSHTGPNLQLHVIAAELYANDARWPQATAQAEAAWRHRKDLAAGSVLIKAQAHMGQLDAAEATYQTLKGRIWKHDRRGHAGLVELRTFLDQRQ